jgi:hypothetical protein
VLVTDEESKCRKNCNQLRGAFLSKKRALQKITPKTIGELETPRKASQVRFGKTKATAT